MNDNKQIKHKGRVVASSDGMVDVSIISESACSSCKVKSACGMSENKEKIVSVFTEFSDKFKVNDDVEVSIRQSMGIKAISYVYILPFVIVLFSLILLIQLGLKDGVAGGISLVILAFYYFVLYLLRRKIERGIIFEIEKI